MPDWKRKGRRVLNEFFTTDKFLSLDHVAEKHNTDVNSIEEIIKRWSFAYTVERDSAGNVRITPNDRWYGEWANLAIAKGERTSYDFRTIYTLHGRQLPAHYEEACRSGTVIPHGRVPVPVSPQFNPPHISHGDPFILEARSTPRVFGLQDATKVLSHPPPSLRNDERLKRPKQYNNFPCSQPYVGVNYRENDTHRQMLVIGESQYFPSDSTINKNPVVWYNSNQDMLRSGPERMAMSLLMLMTFFREESRNDGNAFQIYHKVAYALAYAGFEAKSHRETFDDLAFYNYFQRPAIDGESIVAVDSDHEVAAEVFDWNLQELEPNVVLFVSSKAGESARRNLSCMENMRNRGIHCAFGVHPSTRWWHTPMTNRNNMSGEEIAMDAAKHWLK